jgi:lysophospholipase L1-like esterase
MGYIDLTGQLGDFSPIDVILKGDTALVSAQKSGAADGRVLIVSLAAPARPVVVGTLSGRGGRLALGTGDLANVLFSSGYSPFGGENPLGGVRAATLGAVVLLLDKNKKPLSRIRLPKNFQTYVEAVLPGAGDTVEDVEVSIIDRDGKVRPKTGEIPTQTKLTLQRDPETGRHRALLQVVDKDCALELDHVKETDEEIVKTSCRVIDKSGRLVDLESGPWTRLKVNLPAAYGGLERVTDIRAFRLVAIGDSLTQGVQHGTVVHQDQKHSYPAQLAGQINEVLKRWYGGQQVVFKQAMINEPGIGKPPLRASHGDGPGDPDEDGFPNPGRLNHLVQPINNLGMSGTRVAHLHTAKQGNWPTYRAETPWVCKKNPEKCEKYPSPVDNPEEPKSVWRYVLAPPEATGEDVGTAVEQACDLDPSLLLVFIGNNDALNAPVTTEIRELTNVTDFQNDYDTLMETVRHCTEGRADIVVGTIPDVASIPHMRNLGEEIGAVPFTLPKLPEKLLGLDVAEPVSRQFEKIYLEPKDEFGRCHGDDGAVGCKGGDEGGAKTSLTSLAKTLVVQDLVSITSQLSLFVSQTTLARKLAGYKTITLRSEQVIGKLDLKRVQNNVDAFNRHIKRRAQDNGWAVMDMNQFFKDRTTDEAKNNPLQLNGLFTGTERPARREGDIFRRGMGNTLFGWDGVHPNSAGYSLAANEAIRALVDKLKEADYGGLEKGAVIDPVAEARITELLKENYLKLKWSRIYDWQSLITTVR